MFNISFEIQKKIIINKSPSEIAYFLTDFDQSKLWNPWLILDDEGRTESKNPPHQIGHQQQWWGPAIGEGVQTITGISNGEISVELKFLKPFKSISKTQYILKKIDSFSTELEWTMRGSIPFFLFFLKNFMSVMLQRDLERGLDRLKELCEVGQVLSSFGSIEIIKVKELFYQGIEGKCALSEISTSMRGSFEKIDQDISGMKISNYDGILCVYHEINPVKNFIHYTAGVYSSHQLKKIEGYNDGKVVEHKALKIISKGPYHHLKTAWTKVFSHQRINKLKVSKKIPMIEFMLNDPTRVQKEEILTEIHLGIK